jgi:signal peptidase I
MPELLECRGAELYGLGKALVGSGASFRVEVRGLSMYPFLKEGDVVEVAPIQMGEVERGDVVFFLSGDRLLAHRVIEVAVGDPGTHLMTRGDVFRQADPPVNEECLIGLVTIVYRARRGGVHAIRLDRGLVRWLGLVMARSRAVHRCVRGLVPVFMHGEGIAKGGAGGGSGMPGGS